MVGLKTYIQLSGSSEFHMEIIVLIGFLYFLFTGGALVLGLIYILLKFALGIVLLVFNTILYYLCWTYEKVTKKLTPAPVVKFIRENYTFMEKLCPPSSPRSSDNYNYSDHYNDNDGDF